MTEYDYSPEAYERYLATQNRIANWVDQTEQHRPQFENALSSRPGPMPPHDAHRPPKRSPPPSPPPPPPPHHHRGPYQQPRQLFIHPPSPASDSSEGYGHGPGPMPLSSPGMMVYPPQPPAGYMQPMMSPPPMLMHPSYTAAPHHKSHRHRSPHSHSRSRSQQTPAYYSMASPPVSPGYQYPFPPMQPHPGYIMMQRPMPVMSNLPEPPRSATPNLSSFPTPASGGYFQPHPTSSGPPQGIDGWSYGAASPSHSIVSGSTGTVAVMSFSSQPHYFTSIPQYQGIHSAMASPTYMSGPVPQNMHQRVYDLKAGSKHYLRRSVG